MSALQEFLSFLGTAITGAAGLWLAQAFGLLPKPTSVICYLSDPVIGFGRRLRRPDRSHSFVILVCTVNGDNVKRSHTRVVTSAFLGRKDVDVSSTCRSVPQPIGQGGELKANKVARRFLKRHAADLVIFGEVTKTDSSLKLWFVSPGVDADFQKHQFILSANELGEFFHENVRLGLCALALTSLKPVLNSHEIMLSSVLNEIIHKINALVLTGKNFTPNQIAELRDAMGVAKSAISNMTGNQARTEDAIEDFQAAITIFEQSGDDRLAMA